jgi:putative hydrolase of the HAD superfamily
VSYRAVIFDLGGVVFPSPFDAFDAYDHGNDLEHGTTRALIRSSSETGSWAHLERGELTMDEFIVALEAEALAAGFELDARRLMGIVGSSFGPRPEMERAIARIRDHGLRTAALTNNWAVEQTGSSPNGIHESALFDVVVESAVEGLRKPDPRIYALVLERLDVLASEAVFLDDLGVNLKPAREMGMATIKVVDVGKALTELGALLGLDLEP